MPVERAPRKSTRITVYAKNQGKTRAPENATQRAVQSAEADTDSSASSTDMPGVVDSDVDLSSAPGSPTLPDRAVKESVPSTSVTNAFTALTGDSPTPSASITTGSEGPVVNAGATASAEALLGNLHNPVTDGPAVAAPVVSHAPGGDRHDSGLQGDLAIMGLEGGVPTNDGDSAVTASTVSNATVPNGAESDDERVVHNAATTVHNEDGPGAAQAAGAAPNGPAPVAVSGHAKFPKLGHIACAKLADWVRIATNVDPNAAVFAVGQAPPNASWGTQLNNDAFLVDHRGRIISLLVLMRVEMTFFQTRGGAYAERVVIKGDTVYEGDAEAVNALLARANGVVHPNGPTNADREFYVRRFQSSIGRGGQKIILPFTEVYDAEGGLTHRDQMERVAANQIAQDDIILVECRLRRFRSSSSGKAGPWMDWGVNLDLETAFILHREPVPRRHFGGRPSFSGIIN